MKEINVTDLIKWLQEIPNPDDTEVCTPAIANTIIGTKRIIYGEYKNYAGKDKGQHFVLLVPMGCHFPSTHDKTATENWDEKGQLKYDGQNINHLYKLDRKDSQ